MSWFKRFAALAAVATLVTGCTIATPFRQLQPADDGTVVLVITHAVLDNAKRAAFDEHTQRVVASLRAQPGLLGYSVRRQVLGNEVWTMTAWRDEAALSAFVRGPTHQAAISNGAPALQSVRFCRFTLPATDLPLTWSHAERLLEESGEGYARGANAAR